ncbi:peptidase M36 [Rozella allomycis CSF55]|uniref:Extracellular metalloproteinase n=1 Tax=Rozella allomycis (strain CSF55) TaxID=988480 RepID=A0A4V1IZ65_ROZAC|nr:peptidase M36 [Rozella allomycis CSF55]
MYANEAFTLTNVKSIAKNDIDAKLSYIITENGLLKLVWNLKVDMKGSDNWFDTAVCAYSGNVLSLIDWVADALYNVYPIGTAHPLDGRRALLVDPYPKNASPLGWHQTKSWNSTQTKGNNVYAQENVDGGYDWANNYRPDGGRSLKFDFPIDFKKSPKSYLDAAITNLFFWNNVMHDLFYQYGFNEVSGNFQEDNFGRGGLGMDGVIANAQDGSGTNNANFATPPDGQRGRMRMYVWTQTNPNRDGDLENGIIIHEYGHGISTRLTGGPANSGCLGFGEAGGMGEGWSDVFAVLLRQRPSYNRTMRFSMGDYSNGGIGIRRYDYTTNMKINPETYGYIKKSGYWGVHAKGEVWAGILLESYWNFVDKYGFNENWYNKFGGNSMFLSLVVDGLKLQPCRPTFVDARNAILQADKVKFNGKNSCLLWKGFAKRGLGLKASAGGNEDFSMPTECS